MKLLLLKTLLQRRARDEGFTLPIVIAIGLIMVLLGAVNIMTASEENLNVVSDNSKKKALAIADVGVSRYRQLLDRNRMLMVYDYDDWSSVTGTCDINNASYDGDETNIADFIDPTQWQTVSDGTENIGQYRIISYIYDIDGDLTTDNNAQFAPNDDNPNDDDIHTYNDRDTDGDGDIDNFDYEYDPKGILTIQSQATDGSEAQVQVEIPIRINENDMTNISPALWIGNSDIDISIFDDVIIDGDRDRVSSTEDTDTDDGNIVISKPATDDTQGCNIDSSLDAMVNDDQIQVVYDPRPLPTIIPEPDTILVNDTNVVSDIDSDTDPINGRYVEVRGDNNQLQDMLLLGRPSPVFLHKIWKTDENDIDYFYYKAPSGLIINDNEKLAVDGQSRVMLEVDGDITLTGNASLQAGSSTSSSFRSTGLQVYVKENTGDPNDITINPGTGNTVTIKGLIHAPHSTVNITGAGTVLIEGAMWIKDLTNTGGANIVIIPDNAPNSSDKAYQHYVGTDNREAKPITDAVTEWEIQEVED